MIDGFKVHLGGLWKTKGSNDGKPEKVSKADMTAFDETMDNFMEDTLNHIRMILNKAANDMASKLQGYIFNQMGRWPELSEDYAAWKDKQAEEFGTYDGDTILMYTGNYAQSIQVLPPRDRLGRFTSFRKVTASQIPEMRIQVGLPPGARTRTAEDGTPDSDAPTLRQLSLWLEFGTATMPARPHFGPATFMFKAKELPGIIDSVGRFMTQIRKSAISNRQTKAPRPTKDIAPLDPQIRPDRDARPDPDVILPPPRD